MNRYENFWIVTIFRGVLAILLGSAVLVVPDMARTLLLLPFAVAFAVLSLAAYGIVDSVLVFVTSFFASLRRSRTALRFQSAFGIVLGALFFSILFDKLQLHWFLYLIALQAVATACSEYVIARHTSRRHGSRWSYAAAGAALLCAIGYTIAAAIAPENLEPRQIAFLVYAYLVVFGVTQVLMAMRMLSIERKADALAHATAHPGGV
jgi:uncharacterized membrane protein HdeD (DUF308 family)